MKRQGLVEFLQLKKKKLVTINSYSEEIRCRIVDVKLNKKKDKVDNRRRDKVKK